jgi:hypothetical protein
MAALLALVVILLSWTGPAASAQTAMAVSYGTVKVSARILVTVPVRVVCAGLGGTFEADSLTVSLLQANGRAISSGQTQLNSGIMFGTGPLFVCDGSTVNKIKVSVLPTAGSGPFNPGSAVITVTATHSESATTESDQLGPRVVTLLAA